MGLLDLFKKKKNDSTFPENELEMTLMEAATDASARHGFYTKLLWNDLIVLTASDTPSEEGIITLEEDSEVDLVTLENGEIPVFTSKNRVFDKGIIKEEVPYLTLNGQDLFKLTKGETLILNPYSSYGKELVPEEIESLLDGSIFEQSNRLTVEEGTEVQVGQPSEYPAELVKALCKLFKGQLTLKAAYLGIIKTDNSDKLPHLIIALDVEGELSSITNFAGPLSEKILDNDETIDFIKIDNRGGISDYFVKEVKPFYKRK